MKAFINGLHAALPEGSHQQAVLTANALALLERCSATDVSYAADRLYAILRMPPESRPLVSVVGSAITPYAIIGGAIRFGDEARWHPLFPIGPMQQLTALIAGATYGLQLPPPAAAPLATP